MLKRDFVLSLLLSFSIASPQAWAASGSTEPDGTVPELSTIEREIDGPDNTPQTVLNHLQSFIKAHPGNARAHFLAGLVFDRIGYRNLAEQEFARADKLDPTKPASSLNLFRLKVENDQFAEARELLQYVAQRFPEEPGVHLMRGLLLVRSGKLEEAEKVYVQAAASGKRTVGVYTALAVIRTKQNRYKEALLLAEKDLSLNPNHGSALLVKGESLLHLSRYYEAIPPLQRAFATTVYEKKAAAAMLAAAYIHVGRYATALKPALWNLALSGRHKDMASAKDMIVAITSHLPPDTVTEAIRSVDLQMKDTVARPRLHFALGDVYDKLGKTQLALDQYTVGLEYQPDFGRAWFRLAKDTFIAREYPRALVYYTKAVALVPNDPEVQRNYERFLDRPRKQDLAWQFKDWLYSRVAGCEETRTGGDKKRGQLLRLF